MRKEEIILSALTKDIGFAKKAIPHMSHEFFQDRKERIVFKLINDFWTKYSKIPTKHILDLELGSSKDVPEDDFEDVKEVLKTAFTDVYEYDLQWLLDETEKFCKERAVYNAIMKSVMIINGEDKKTSEGEIPTMLQHALSISFHLDVGHDYFNDSKKRYEYYHRVESKIASNVDILNKVTGGGVNRKTLNILVAPPKAGKSLIMCSLACDYIRNGHNVLYITLELAEERVAERIDANMFNVPLSSIKDIDEETFNSKIDQIKSKTHGKLKIKEYPTKTAHAGNFKVLLDECKTKEGFVPDVVFIDYLGITASSQYRSASTNINSYTYQKAVSEEMRALAVENDLAVWTAVQTNRTAYNASDYDMDAIADSTGPLMTGDFVLGLIRTPEMDEMKQMVLKQLASRYGDPDYYRKFIVGLDKSRMKIFNVDESAQAGLNNMPAQETKSSDKPTMDRYSKPVAKHSIQTATDDWEF